MLFFCQADACNRLWVLDTGTVGIGNTTQNVCPYSILVFDLVTDQLLRRYTLRAQDTNANTFIANIAVDVGRSCDDTFMYASDELGYGLIVYSWELNTSWRVQHGYFLPDPLKGACARARACVCVCVCVRTNALRRDLESGAPLFFSAVQLRFGCFISSATSLTENYYCARGRARGRAAPRACVGCHPEPGADTYEAPTEKERSAGAAPRRVARKEPD